MTAISEILDESAQASVGHASLITYHHVSSASHLYTLQARSASHAARRVVAKR
jgi:hypothetical protein